MGNMYARNQDDVIEIVMGLMNLDFNEQEFLIDEDYLMEIQLKSKKITSKYSTLVGPQYIPFDLIKNKLLMKTIFDYFIEKIHKQNGVYVTSITSQSNKEQRTISTTVSIARENNEMPIRITSNYFNNINLSYIDLICKLSNIELSIAEGIDGFTNDI